MDRDRFQARLLLQYCGVPQNLLMSCLTNPRPAGYDLCAVLESHNIINAQQSQWVRVQTGQLMGSAQVQAPMAPASAPATPAPSSQHEVSLGEVQSLLNKDSQSSTSTSYEVIEPSPYEVSYDEDTQRVGPYELKEMLGQGGMGVVYKAYHTVLDRTVALKMLLTSGSNEEVALERFEIEAQSMARLRHPNIINVLEVEVGENLAYMTMDLVEGGTVSDHLKEEGAYKWREALSHCGKIAHALDHAHERHIIHRDLKPANILLTLEGEPILTDFGLAKQLSSERETLTKTGQIMGTPHYMAPEQIDGKEANMDGRTDIYALGITLYEMLTGELPFQANTTVELFNKVLMTAPPKVSTQCQGLPADVETIIERCLSKEPEQRYETARELAEDCERVVKGQPIKARPLTSLEKLQSWYRRNTRTAHGALALTGAGLLLLVGFYINSKVRLAQVSESGRQAAEAARDKAEQARQETQRALKKARVATEQLRQEHDKTQAALAQLKESEQRLKKSLQEVQRARKLAEQAGNEARAAHKEAQLRVLEGTVQKAQTEAENRRWGKTAAFASEALLQLDKVAEDYEELRQQAEGAGRQALARGAWLWRRGGALPVVGALAVGDHYVAMAGERRLIVWDARDGRVCLSRSHPRTVTALAFQADERALVLACEDGELEWLSLSSASQRRFKLEGPALVSLRAGAEGAWLALDREGQLLRLEPSDKAWKRSLIRRLKVKVKAGWLAEERLVVLTEGELLWSSLSAQGAVQKQDLGEAALDVSGDPKLGRLAVLKRDQLLLMDLVKKDVRVVRLTAQPASVALAEGGERLVLGYQDGRLEGRAWSDGKILGQARGGRVRRQFVKTGASPGVFQLTADGGLERRDPKTLALLSFVAGHRGVPSQVAVNSAKGLVASAGPQSVMLWRLDDGRPQACYKLPAPLVGLSFSPDGELLVGATEKGELWQLRVEARLVSTRKLAVNPVCFALSPDKQSFAIGQAEGRVLLYDVAVDKPEADYQAHEGPVTRLVFSKDGRVLASGGEDEKVVVWSLESSRVMHRLEAYPESIVGLCYGPDGLLYGAARDGTVIAWRDHGAAMARRLETLQSMEGFELVAEAQLMAVRSRGHDIRILDAVTGTSLGELEGHSDRPTALAADKLGIRLATVAVDGSLRLWKIEAPRRQRALVKSRPRIVGLAYGGGERLAYALKNGVVEVAKLASGEAEASLKGHSGRILGLCFVGRDALLSAGSDRTLRLHRLSGARQQRLLRSRQGVPELLCGAGRSSCFAWSAGNLIHVWDSERWQELSLFKEHRDRVTGLAMDERGRLLVSGARDGTIRLWDLKARRLRDMLKSHGAAVQLLALDKGGRTLVSFGQDNKLSVWTINERVLEGQLTLTERPVMVSVSDDGGAFALGFDKGLIRVYDTASRQLRFEKRVHRGRVTGLCFLNRAELLSSSSDRTVRKTLLTSSKTNGAKSGPVPVWKLQHLGGFRVRGYQLEADPGWQWCPVKR